MTKKDIENILSALGEAFIAGGCSFVGQNKMQKHSPGSTLDKQGQYFEISIFDPLDCEFDSKEAHDNTTSVAIFRRVGIANLIPKA